MTKIASSGRSVLFTPPPYAYIASSGRSVLFYEGGPAPTGPQPTAQGTQVSGAQLQGQWMKPRPTQL